MAALIEGTVTGPTAIRRTFEASPEVVQQGRLLVESQSRTWKIAQETIDSAVLVASEILTNAVRATRGRQISLRLALTGDGLRIEVWDPSPAKPRPSAPDLTMPLEPVPDDAPDPSG
jgi:anti-sigma regulatory factor (Ser/Thr protein kinase)